MTTPTSEQIKSTLAAALEDNEGWIERLEFNEFNDPNAPAAVEQLRRDRVVLEWLRDHHTALRSSSSGALPTRDEGMTDYPAAARSIALNLQEFCDESLPYPDMIADAARKARAEIESLRTASDRGASDREDAERWQSIAASWVLQAHGHGYGVAPDIVAWAEHQAPYVLDPTPRLRAAIDAARSDTGHRQTQEG